MEESTCEKIKKRKFTRNTLSRITNIRIGFLRLVFNNKRDLLDLYNALNNTCYENPNDLEVNTLEDAVYLSMKNDISFLIGGH